jgi:NAD(P)-dependent dehydrogenase (short-subunit alcohol dehydrogenase family)
VTGGSQGIGAGLAKRFLALGYNVVASSRYITKSGAFDASDKLALVDGDIGEAATATRIAETAQSKFGSIDALVNNAGIYFSKPFTDYSRFSPLALFVCQCAMPDRTAGRVPVHSVVRASRSLCRMVDGFKGPLALR